MWHWLTNNTVNNLAMQVRASVLYTISLALVHAVKSCASVLNNTVVTGPSGSTWITDRGFARSYARQILWILTRVFYSAIAEYRGKKVSQICLSKIIIHSFFSSIEDISSDDSSRLLLDISDLFSSLLVQSIGWYFIPVETTVREYPTNLSPSTP